MNYTSIGRREIMCDCDDSPREFTMPFKQKRTPFKRCDECEKRKFSTNHYHVYDNGLNSYIPLLVCKWCMIEAKARQKLINARRKIK